MSDLVKRLREDFRGCPFPSVYTTCNEAADELERLQAESAKLRKHAEAMYVFLQRGIARFLQSDDSWQREAAVLEAYRADFPKEPDNGK